MRVPKNLLRRVEALEARRPATVVTWRPAELGWALHARLLLPALTAGELDAWEAILDAVPAGQKLSPEAHHQVTRIFAAAEARRTAALPEDTTTFFRELVLRLHELRA